MPSGTPEWKQKAAAKRAAQYESIPREWRLPEPLPQPKNTYTWLKSSGLLTPQELSITETTDAAVLLRRIASGALSAVEVTKAYCHRAALAQQLIRCCTEMFFEQAIADAEALDEHFRRTGKVVGPLHGLPISFKDGFDVKGQDSTLGWVSEIGRRKAEDATLVKVLRALGAVCYVKTNVPQSLMMSDSYNHIFKQSLNAFQNELISGGSSGGEGALVGVKGSIIGIGTDIGGSIRIPANLQGLYGLSPSARRIPWQNSAARDYIIPSVCGPMCSSLSSLEFFMEAMLSGEPWNHDPAVVPLPWRKSLAGKPASRPLRIGYYYDDGYVRVQPPIELAVKKAIEALKAAGHDVLPWDTAGHLHAYDLWLKGVLADGGARCRVLCEKGSQPLIEGMLVGTAKDRLDVAQGEALAKEIRAYQTHYLSRWREANLDALIMPVQPYVGFRPGEWVKSSQYVGYSAHWNLCDYAGITVPVEVPCPGDVPDSGDGRGSWREHKARNESDRYNWEQYDLNLIRDMPVCIQVIGGKFGEEKAVAVAKAVEEALSLHKSADAGLSASK